MNVKTQIERGILICPKTGKQLKPADGGSILATDDGGPRYGFHSSGVPILLGDEEQAREYLDSSSDMKKIITRFVSEPAESSEHAGAIRGGQRADRKPGFVKRLKNNDFRSKKSIERFNVLVDQPESAVCLSIGGGPNRPHPNFTNLNIGPFPNVDIVADAHHLPYADNSVDAIYCEAVLEHLYDPPRAVREMFRVLRPGGRVLSITPFLQEYHGYPYHYCNFTLTGHSMLYEKVGFEITDSGACVGPMYTVCSLTIRAMNEYFPKLLKVFVKGPFKFLSLFVLRPLDSIFSNRENAFVLASTTYVYAEKKSAEGSL
ncbi:MAG TPA: class I SAM-dependent methyltransferase [bacterium]|nr:class I SAM-dependent methyltransferase [bacterium]